MGHTKRLNKMWDISFSPSRSFFSNISISCRQEDWKIGLEEAHEGLVLQRVQLFQQGLDGPVQYMFITCKLDQLKKYLTMKLIF